MADQHTGQVQTHGSRTAELVAVSRARHLLRHKPPYIFHDPFAFRFLSKRWKRILGSRLRDAFVSKIVLRRLMPITTQPLTRARFTEDCLLAAIEDGVGQYVILGSGYDTFALRHPRLEVTIYEIDLASTIALKRERAEAAGLALPDSLRLIPIDFEKDDLADRLIAHGFAPEKRSFFNWLGVTYYLSRDAIQDTMNKVAGITCPGSEIVFDYLAETNSIPEEERSLAVRLKNYVGRLGEPMITSFDPTAVETDFNAGGKWDVARNDSPADQQKRYVEGRGDVYALPPLFWCLHLRRRG
ncbi:MAG: class I SAM-dependent methyltransferase [Gemmatimonadetes bacterium]|nr:class I SAM-dependent methyltransferase [Gemmatimonadota bacterium]MYG86318.1 class I SAM-dependent methyltransferase [Gemmatimonadota bacterium]MYJ90741.1 class I SAM-dependent methyltransferase [Gemmatimonadota bacterium]